jgi:hypothetical protein
MDQIDFRRDALGWTVWTLLTPNQSKMATAAKGLNDADVANEMNKMVCVSLRFSRLPMIGVFHQAGGTGKGS